jgi:DNA-binding IclR family transcriptional regulator
MRSVERICSILGFLSEHPTGTLAGMAKATGLAKPTAFRLAEAMTSNGLLARVADAGYQLGPRLIYIALKGSGLLDLRAAARPAMAKLAAETGETVALSILLDQARMYIDQIESTQPIRRVIEVNAPLPLNCGASAKALLAWMPEEEVRKILSAQSQLPWTERTVTNPEALMRQIKTVRQTGYAKSHGERIPDGSAVAAPIVAQNGDVLAALAVLAPRHRAPDEKLVSWAPLVIRAALDVAVAYGAAPPAKRGGRPWA